MTDVVGIGVSTLDLLHLVDEFPAGEGVQRSKGSALVGGGPVATALVTLSRLGASTAMVDSLGDDWRSRMIIEEFAREGVAADCIQMHTGASASIASVLVRVSDGARHIIFSPGSAPELTPQELPASIIQNAGMLHLNGRHQQASLRAIEIARKAGVLISFDGGAGRYTPEHQLLVAQTSICIVALDYANALTQYADPQTAGLALLAAGPRLVVITNGLEGSWVFTEDDQFHQPAFQMAKVVDTTGCGDSYHGAFLFGVLKGLQLRSAARLAAAVAAMNTQALGGRSALPTFQQAQVFLQQHPPQ